VGNFPRPPRSARTSPTVLWDLQLGRDLPVQAFGSIAVEGALQP
jgi:hypothetical protein